MLLRNVAIPALVFLAILINREGRSQSLTWTDLNSANRSNIQCLLIRPSGETLAGDDSGRVLKFEAGGIDWSRAYLPTWPLTSQTVNALAAHPNGHLFAAAGPGVFACTDGGTQWMSISSAMSPMGPILRAIAVTPGGVLVAGGSRGVVYRSTNEGVNWSSRGITGIEISSLLSFDASNLFLGSSRGIYVSTNDGANWTVASSALVSRNVRALARDNEGRLYAATDTGAYVSVDTGRTWTRGSGLPAANAICVLTGGDLLAGNGTSELFWSTDRGSTWASTGAAPIINARCLVAGSNGAVEGGTADGLYVSTEVAATWTKLGWGLTGRHLTAVGATPAHLVVATRDSLVYSALIGEPWSRVEGPPTGTAVRCFSGIAVTGFLVGTSGSGIYRSVDGGKTWAEANAGLTNSNVNAILARTPAVIFAGTDAGVYRSLDSGKTWSPASYGLPSFPVRALGMSVGSPLYAGTGGAGVYRSTDDGSSWLPATNGLTGADVRALLVVPGGPVLAGVEGSGVFYSTDGGTSWTQANSGLPDLSVRGFATPASGELFVATPSGVYTAAAAGSSWVVDTAGLAGAPTGLALALDRYLLCATDGSGLFSAWTQLPQPPLSPVTNWMTVGSLHTWYSAMGSEIEEGRVNEQQDGTQWPAIMPRQDMQHSKALWIGATNYTDPTWVFYPRKVVHVGPRVAGTGEFIPISFVTSSKFDPPTVLVNGTPSQLVSITNDSVNPALEADRTITNEVNTALGISMKRRILQFSHPLHDNYIVQEYEFTNTGNLDADPFIEQPGVTLDSVYFYFLHHWAINKDIRYVIGNATGWGINTMHDTRGDGVMADPVDQQFRANYAWHGYYPNKAVSYDNIGGPIWYPYVPYQGAGDTVGRLGSPQFVGVVTLHADASPANHADDPLQPTTTSWEDADASITVNNSQFNTAQMTAEYLWMSRGHKSPRHAWAVEPQGNFSDPMGDPALGTPGGFSAATGYGPYRMGPGDTVRIVFAEAAAGLDQERRVSIGKLFKQGLITAHAKNDSVFTGRDSLFQTFRRALANYSSGYGIPSPPYPPRELQVRSGNPIRIEWEPAAGGPRVNSFRIFRTEGRYDGEYTLVGEVGSSGTVFTDSLTVPATAYYYYLTAVGDSLSSSRDYTQTYTPVYRTTVGVEDGPDGLPKVFFLEKNYPNPFNPSTTIRYGLPRSSMVRLAIFNAIGQQVAVLEEGEKKAGYHEIRFDAAHLASGVYFYRLQARPLHPEAGEGNFIQTRKLLLLR